MPKVVAVMIDPSANRSVEYDTVSDATFKFVTEVVLPRVQTHDKGAFVADPQGARPSAAAPVRLPRWGFTGPGSRGRSARSR